MRQVTIRTAQPDDAEAVIDLLGKLNEHERVSGPDADTRLRLRRDGFGPSPKFAVTVAESPSGTILGFALYFRTYCSFLARPVLCLDAMYVPPECRGQHVGSGLFYSLAQTAVDWGCPRMEWSVYGFNTVAVEFYDHVGATPVFEWDAHRTKEFRVYRLEDDALRAAAARSPSARRTGQPTEP